MRIVIPPAEPAKFVRELSWTLNFQLGRSQMSLSQGGIPTRQTQDFLGIVMYGSSLTFAWHVDLLSGFSFRLEGCWRKLIAIALYSTTSYR